MRGKAKKYLKQITKKNSKAYVFYILTGLLATTCAILSSKLYENLIDSFSTKKSIALVISLYSFVILGSCIFSYVQTYPEQKLKHSLNYDFKLLAIKKLETIDYQAYQKLGIGKSTQNVENGAKAGQDMIFDFKARLIWEILPSVFLSLLFIALIDIKILFIIMILYVFIFIFTNLLLKKLYKFKDKLNVKMESFNGRFIRAIMEMLVFRINKRYKYEIEKCEELASQTVDMKAKLRMIHECFFFVFELISSVVKIGIIIFAFVSSSLTVGALVSLLVLMNHVFSPISIFNVIFVDYKLNKITFDRYVDFLESEDDCNLISGESFNAQNFNIDICDVSFKYGKKEVLKNINMKIKENTTIAIVGETGSGKSTLIKLLTGLNKLQDGEIFIDKESLRTVNLNEYYSSLAYISQESPIFDGTLRENIVFDKNIDDEEIIKILEKVELKEFYSKLENGLDTIMGERGVLVSGGERQRIAIARLFFTSSKLIIFDEATSALDNVTEKRIIETISNDLLNKTKIMIAHRLSTIVDVDEIFVLKNGVIIESGTFKGLLSNKKEFYNLYNANKNNA